MTKYLNHNQANRVHGNLRMHYLSESILHLIV